MVTRTLEPAGSLNLSQNPRDFSLILGGPLFQLLRQIHLTDEALGLVVQRIIAISLFTWLPLLVFSAVEGRLLGGRPAVPFLLDMGVNVRFLVVVPLLIAAEPVVHRRMRLVARQFLARHLIPEGALTRFNAATASVFQLRNSVLAEVSLLVFVYAFDIFIASPHSMGSETATWYTARTPGGVKLAFAGLWYGFVSLPIFQFLLFRWYFRLFIWMRFLWQVSRIELSLVPTHPDRVGGLGFLSQTVFAFMPVLIAHGALLAGLLGNRIYYLGAQLPDFMMTIFVVIVALICLVVGPLVVFAPQLARTKRLGEIEYGGLAQRYVREFDAKWLRGGAPGDETLLGSGDIQSLADIGASLERVETIRLAPFTLITILQLAAAIFAPVAPLLLTMVPLEELLKKLLGLLL
jgi:hypothetical protein